VFATKSTPSVSNNQLSNFEHNVTFGCDDVYQNLTTKVLNAVIAGTNVNDSSKVRLSSTLFAKPKPNAHALTVQGFLVLVQRLSQMFKSVFTASFVQNVGVHAYEQVVHVIKSTTGILVDIQAAMANVIGGDSGLFMFVKVRFADLFVDCAVRLLLDLECKHMSSTLMATKPVRQSASKSTCNIKQVFCSARRALQ